VRIGRDGGRRAADSTRAFEPSDDRRLAMIDRQRLLLAAALAGATALTATSAQAFWGPFNPWNWDGPGWGGYHPWGGYGPWGGGPWYGVPYYGYAAPYGWGYPGVWAHPYPYYGPHHGVVPPASSAPASSDE
jgi:hypothetical protein